MRSKAVVFLLAVGLLLGRSAFGVTQVITNGSFNLGNSGWSEEGTLSDMNFNGSSLAMGGLNGPIQAPPVIYQTVTIPANTLYALYSYEWQATTLDPADTSIFYSAIANTSQEVFLPYLDVEPNNVAGPIEDTFSLSNYIGQTIDVAFELQVTNTGIGSQSFFYVTDVSLLAYTAADIPTNTYFTNSVALSNTTNRDSIVATNFVATKQPNEPNVAGNPGGHLMWWNWTAVSNGIVTINTSGSTFSTLLGVYTGTDLGSLAQVAANNGGRDSQVRFPTTAGTTYQIAVDGKNGAVGYIQLNLVSTLDKTPPKLSIKTPASGAKLTNSTVVVSGTASDFVGLTSVQVQLGNAQGTNAYQNATGTTNWTFTVTDLSPGLNIINVQAIDTSDNATTNSDKVTFIVVSPLTVTITGSGTVSPDLTNKLLDVGTDYTITAKPGTGQVFSNWVGPDGVLATTAKLTFTMQSNLVLQANFVPNPFTPLVGDYQGLFYDTSTNGPQHESSGFFNVTLASSGSYSAKVIVAGVNYSLTGQFSAGGVASNNIVRKGGLPAVSVQMQLDLTGSGITGVLSDGTWVAQLNADKVAASAGAAAGHYTMVIPGVGEPGGDSYGTLTISSTGIISFGGALADGTKVTQKANMTSNGQWAFYIPLYSGNGSIFGWLTFNDEVDSDITGTVDWFKLAGASGKLYPGGFTNVSDATGSVYLFTNGAPVVTWPGGGGMVLFSGGGLASAFENPVSLSSANKITNSGTNALTATITTSTGLFTVKATDPTTGQQITGNGVLLQKQNMGSGFFTDTNQTGVVIMGPPL